MGVCWALRLFSVSPSDLLNRCFKTIWCRHFPVWNFSLLTKKLKTVYTTEATEPQSDFNWFWVVLFPWQLSIPSLRGTSGHISEVQLGRTQQKSLLVCFECDQYCWNKRWREWNQLKEEERKCKQGNWCLEGKNNNKQHLWANTVNII